nr:MAG TPA: hypothetical protein [Caudoviricetes sp.]
MSHKTPSKNTHFCDTSKPNKHWSKRLRFGEDFPRANTATASCRRTPLPNLHHLNYCTHIQQLSAPP